jgi:hypothetical protein
LARDRRALAVQSSLDTAEVSLDGLADVQVGMTGQLRWRPPISGPGFYRVRVEMEGRETVCQREQLSLAVIEPSNAPAAGEFGWSLPDGDKPVPLGELSRLVGQAGIRWLKYPLWYDDAQSDAAAEQLVTFSERVHAYGIELIGLLHKPPGAIRDRYGRQGALRAAELFAPDPEVWYPSLEPVMSRLATRVRWWQLGRDEDGSFADYRNPAIKVAQVKRELDRIGQNVNLGIGWHWIDALPGAGAAQAPWRFLTLSADPPMTHEELAEYLDAAAGARVGRWVVVEPLSRSHYPTAVRADDLVRRMLAANIHGADAVFCPDPFDAEHGLMNPDGTPGELFLPWRTTALALAGATYLGSIQLPSGSPNFIFARHDDALMVVWNERPTEEVLYLGDKVRQIDLWGQAATPEKRGHRQVIEVGPLPSFVTGLSEPVARWRMQFEFARQRLPSVFGRAHADSFSLKNTFVGGTGGRATLVMPERWQVSPPEVDFRLSAGEPLTQPLQILLPYSASSGRHPVRVDFDLQADRRYQFSVYRHIDVGMGDVYLELATRLNEQGELEVEQRMVNEGDGRVNFRCQLYAPERRRQKTDVLGLGPGRAVHVYRIPDGQELLGKTLWLRAEEIEGPRILNYRFPARP